MDTKHRKVYGRLKIYGVKDSIEVKASSMVGFLQALAKQFQNAPSRYEGGNIEFSFKPMERNETSLEAFQREWAQTIDLSQVEMETDEQEAMRLNAPNDPKLPEYYDPLFVEYIMCINPIHRDKKTPDDLRILKRNMERYEGTPWWNGIHKF